MIFHVYRLSQFLESSTQNSPPIILWWLGGVLQYESIGENLSFLRRRTLSTSGVHVEGPHHLPPDRLARYSNGPPVPAQPPTMSARLSMSPFRFFWGVIFVRMRKATTSRYRFLTFLALFTLYPPPFSSFFFVIALDLKITCRPENPSSFSPVLVFLSLPTPHHPT